jgi:hypothetical protein
MYPGHVTLHRNIGHERTVVAEPRDDGKTLRNALALPVPTGFFGCQARYAHATRIALEERQTECEESFRAACASSSTKDSVTKQFQLASGARRETTGIPCS